jgi:AcrR family transcriptional regulator
MINPAEKKEDLRIRRTYKLLFEALISLLKERPFEEVNVTDICDRAMVHRTTFYKHFEDKYHLLRCLIKDLQKDFNESSKANVNLDNPQQYYTEILRRVLLFFADDQKMYSSILANNENGSIIIMFYQLVAEDIAAKLKYFEKKGIKHNIPIPVITNFRTGALIALISWWVRKNMPVPIEEMVKYVDLMVKDEGYLL